MVIGAVHPDLRLVDGRWRERALVLHNDVGWNVRHHVVRSKRICGIVNIGVIHVVAEVRSVFVVESVVEAGHAGIFAHRVGGDFRDLIGNAIHGLLSERIRVQDGLECGRLREYHRAKRRIRHKISECLAKALPQAFIVQIEKCLVLNDGAAEAGAKLVQRKWR